MNEEQFVILDPDGNEAEIPVEGSLALLALGDLGYIAWKQKIQLVKREMASRSAEARSSGASPEAAPAEITSATPPEET